MATTTEERIYIVPAFDGGMQRRSTKFLAQQREVLFAKNTDFQYKLGGIAKALGYTKKGNSISGTPNILGCGSLNTSGGVDKILAFAGTDAYVWDGGTTWTAQSRSYSASQLFETERFLDQLFEVNGLTDVPENYDGATWSQTRNITDMPKSKFIKEYAVRLFLFNLNLPVGGNFPSRIWFSDLPVNNAITWGFESGTDLASTAASATVTSAGGAFQTRNIKVGDPFFIVGGNNDGEYEVQSVNSQTSITLTKTVTNTNTNQSFWVGGNYFDVARDNSDVGMGLGKNSDRILFFKRFSLWKFLKGDTDESDSLIEIKGVPGTVSHRSITNVRDWTFYWSDTGLWRCNGVTSQLMSNSMQEIVDGIDPTSLDDIVGWSVGDRIVKMFLGDINNTTTGLVINKCVYCYDAFSNASWVEEYDDTIRASVKWIESSALKNFIFSSDGEVFQSENGNAYNGNAFPMEVETYFYFPIAPEVSINFTRFKIYTEHGREINTQFKLAYFDGRIDDDWRRLHLKDKTEHEQEWRVPETENRAAGFALKFIESEATNARPVIERVAAYYTGGEIR